MSTIITSLSNVSIRSDNMYLSQRQRHMCMYTVLLVILVMTVVLFAGFYQDYEHYDETEFEQVLDSEPVTTNLIKPIDMSLRPSQTVPLPETLPESELPSVLISKIKTDQQSMNQK